MSDDANKLRIAARWGYRSYESEAGRRDDLFSDLLRELHASSDCSLAMVALESWDVTKKDFESRFDVETPILYTDRAHVEVFRTIALVRTLNDRIARTDPEWGQAHSISFMHFILGNAARKHAFVVDLVGTEGIDRHKVLRDGNEAVPSTGAVDSQRAAAETSHGEAERSPSVIEVLLPQSRLADLRRKHERLRSGIDALLQRNRPEPDVGMATQETPGIAELSMLVKQADRIADPAEPADYDPDCEILLPLLRELQADIDSDLEWALPAGTLAQWVSGQENVREGSSLTGLASAFLRQAFLQAVLVPKIDDCPVAVVVPDMSHKVSASGRDMGTETPGGMETSSLALQFFPHGGMRSAIPDFAFWATLVSIVGRGKTVHDFSLAEREAERIRMADVLHAISHHDLQNLDVRVGGAIGGLLNEWAETSDDRKVARLQEIRANARLAFMGAGLDCLWAGANRTMDLEFVFDLKRILEPAVQFRRKHVRFVGDWEAEVLVPSALRVVFANLIRNAVNVAGNREIHLDAAATADAVEFTCRSEKPMVKRWQKQAFIDPLLPDPPDKHRGLWICRRVVVDLCDGEWSLAGETPRFKTNIRVRVPIGTRDK